jgi:uncharacterized protein
MNWVLPLCVIWVLFVSSCNHRPQPSSLSAADSTLIVQENRKFRAEHDVFFRTDPGSPFVRDTSVQYHGINWYPIDPRYRGHSILHHYATPETVTVYGTKGEPRKQLKYGYFEFTIPGENGQGGVSIRLQVYKFTPSDARRYQLYPHALSVWFTDRTTGQETYQVGRYVEVDEESPDPAFVYTIDLNQAYNPYCAYSAMYSCAIPPKEDHVDLALRVGEMKYHE